MRLGVDIGGTTIKIGLVDDNHKIIDRIVIDTASDQYGAKEIIEHLAKAAKQLMSRNGLSDQTIEQIGIACPGTVDAGNGDVVYSNNLNWENVAFTKELRKYIHCGQIRLANDADAAAWGECVAGSAKGHKNVILLTLGTGVGGGIVLNGQLFHGGQKGGVEPGHMCIHEGGRTCTCGRKGCLEQYASATALMRDAREAVEGHSESMLYRRMLDGELNGRTIFEAEKAGDMVARRVVQAYERDLSEGIANLINIFRPEVVLLGGGVSAQREYLTDALETQIAGLCFGGKRNELPHILVSSLGNDAGIIGAANL